MRKAGLNKFVSLLLTMALLQSLSAFAGPAAAAASVSFRQLHEEIPHTDHLSLTMQAMNKSMLQGKFRELATMRSSIPA